MDALNVFSERFLSRRSVQVSTSNGPVCSSILSLAANRERIHNTYKEKGPSNIMGYDLSLQSWEKAGQGVRELIPRFEFQCKRFKYKN